MIDRPDNLRQHVRDAVAEGDEYATPYAWVLEDGDALFYTCKNCGRVFEGHHAFAGHCGSTAGCGEQPGQSTRGRSMAILAAAAGDTTRRLPDSGAVRDILEARRAERTPHGQRQIPHEPKPKPAPAARRWWWPF